MIARDFTEIGISNDYSGLVLLQHEDWTRWILQSFPIALPQPLTMISGSVPKCLIRVCIKICCFPGIKLAMGNFTIYAFSENILSLRKTEVGEPVWYILILVREQREGWGHCEYATYSEQLDLIFGETTVTFGILAIMNSQCPQWQRAHVSEAMCTRVHLPGKWRNLLHAHFPHLFSRDHEHANLRDSLGENAQTFWAVPETRKTLLSSGHLSPPFSPTRKTLCKPLRLPTRL